ncbi:MAG: glycosyltransferase [Acidimicrobiales bacterium]
MSAAETENMRRLEAIVAELPEAERIDIEAWDDYPAFKVRKKNFVFADQAAESMSVKLSKEETAAVVATDISGVSELVIDGVTGVLVPQRDAAALAAAIATLLDDAELRARLGRAGREHVAQSYDLQHNAAALVRLLTATSAGADEGDEAVIEGATS